MRTGTKLTYLLSDPHGTGSAQVTADATQTVTRRKSGIFGTPRGNQPANWAGDKGFIGGTKDTDTGLTHLGAREYDPTIGRFISVDPIMDLTDPQQAHGYTYGSNNPLLYSDPSGQMQMCGEGGAACYPGGWNNDGTTNTDCNRSSNDTYKTSSGCSSASMVSTGGGGGGGGGGTSGGGGGTSGEGGSGHGGGGGGSTCDLKCQRAAYAKANGGGDSDPTSLQMILMWLTGTAPPVWTFGEGDAFTEELKNHYWIQQMRVRISDGAPGRWADGGWNAADFRIKDMSDKEVHEVFKYDLKSLFPGSKESSAGIATGSYNLQFRMTGYNAETKKMSIEFHMFETMTAASAGREISSNGYKGGKNWPITITSALVKRVYPDGQRDTRIDVRWTESLSPMIMGPKS
ncbi:RHS repeat domain-containing protein [Streptomyces sp. NPDC055897]